MAVPAEGERDRLDERGQPRRLAEDVPRPVPACSFIYVILLFPVHFDLIIYLQIVFFLKNQPKNIQFSHSLQPKPSRRLKWYSNLKWVIINHVKRTLALQLQMVTEWMQQKINQLLPIKIF